MMNLLGFNEKSCSWIKECVAIVLISFLVNDSPCGEFKLHKDMQQGDLLPPFLFLIATKGLNLLLVDRVKLTTPFNYLGVLVGAIPRKEELNSPLLITFVVD